eukprot:scaffold111930_cov40-Attheya_sp.AAC.1
MPYMHSKDFNSPPPATHTIIVKGGLEWPSTSNEIRPMMTKLIYEHCDDHYCNTNGNKKVDPFLCLGVNGCELLLEENVDVPNGLANEIRGILKGYKLKPGQHIHMTCVN